MLQEETFISGNSAILASTPSFVGLRSALKTIFFISTTPDELQTKAADQIGVFSTVST
jgi:hypothetical protein